MSYDYLAQSQARRANSEAKRASDKVDSLSLKVVKLTERVRELENPTVDTRRPVRELVEARKVEQEHQE